MIEGLNNLLKRNNKITVFLGKTYLKLTGWKVQGIIPNRSKILVIVGPHTSNWDFVIVAVVSIAVDIKASFFGKHTLFKIPVLKSIMHWLGGIPVERSSKHGFVEQMVEQYKKRESLMLALSPEGTRKRVERWKTGFYYISLNGNVPIVLDYGKKIVTFHKEFAPSGNIERDLKFLLEIFNTAKPKKPELFNSISAF